LRLALCGLDVLGVAGGTVVAASAGSWTCAGSGMKLDVSAGSEVGCCSSPSGLENMISSHG